MKSDIDTIWLYYDTNMNGEPFIHASVAENKSFSKYLRAEPVYALLKQARGALVRSNQGHTTINDKLNTNDTITAIDKFLEGK